MAGDKYARGQKVIRQDFIAKSELHFPKYMENVKPEGRVAGMRRNLTEIIAESSAEKRQAIEARDQDVKQEVGGLRELRRLAGKAQGDIAAALKIKQPSVSKIEKQTDMYVSTLRSYIEAAGGQLELTVRLPKRPALRIHCLGDIGILPQKTARRIGNQIKIGGGR